MIPIAVTDGFSAATWEQAVESAAELLVGLGVATSGYPGACVDIVRRQGPYIVLAPGLALVHARPESGGRALGIGCVRLDEPVTFGHKTNDPVDLLISFCSPDDSQHITALTSLAKALAQGLAQQLRNAGGGPEVKKYLEEALT
ncbi:PTS sugar transporter subunit IIA [Micromonospora sp. LZ34]